MLLLICCAPDYLSIDGVRAVPVHVGYLAWAILCAGLGVQNLRVARLQWRGDATAEVPQYRGVPIDPSAPPLRRLYRARLPAGICSLSMAAIAGTLTITPAKPSKFAGIFLICVLGVLVASAVGLWLAQRFGRPRFLVPPVLR
jgi:hypothetical protein